AHGMSTTERIMIGSVSRKVLSHVSCSVRIARNYSGTKHTSPRLIIGFDGSLDAQMAVQEVARRGWPERTQGRLITVVDDSLRTAIAARILKLDQWMRTEQTDDHHVWLSRMSESAADQLRSTRLETTCLITEGDPKRVLLEEARHWQANCIFMGATGLRGLRRLLLGSRFERRRNYCRVHRRSCAPKTLVVLDSHQAARSWYASSQYEFTWLGSKRSLFSTATMKLNSFRRTSLASLGYQTGCAITKPRNAKKGATTSSISSSPVLFKYLSQNRKNSDSKFPSSRPDRCNEKNR